MQHSCLRLLLGDNSAFRWRLGNGDAMIRIDVPGNCTISDTQSTIDAAPMVWVRRLETPYPMRSCAMDGWKSFCLNGHRPVPASTCIIRADGKPRRCVMIELIRAREGLPPLVR